MKKNNARTAKAKKQKSLKLAFIISAIVLAVIAAVVISIAIANAPKAPGEEEPKVELEFTPVSEIVYAYYDLDGDGYCDDNVKINLRDFPTTDSDIKLSLLGGTRMTRVAVYYESEGSTAGWSMVEYEGNLYYCRNSCLSKNDPANSDRPPINY